MTSPQLKELRCTWHEKERGLMWTEFVPTHRAGEALRQAERKGDQVRAAAIAKALEAQRRAEPAACAPVRADGGGRVC